MYYSKCKCTIWHEFNIVRLVLLVVYTNCNFLYIKFLNGNTYKKHTGCFRLTSLLSPVGTVCPSLVAAYSGLHWSPGFHTHGLARHDAGWQPAAELQLQALAMTTGPSPNWTPDRSKNHLNMNQGTCKPPERQNSEIKCKGTWKPKDPERTAFCQLTVIKVNPRFRDGGYEYEVLPAGPVLTVSEELQLLWRRLAIT